jgi:hypothetical protein
VAAFGKLVSLGLAAVLAGPAPHPGPPVYVEVRVDEGAVRCVFTGEQMTLCRWLGKADPDLAFAAPLAGGDEAWIRERVAAFAAEHQPFAIDGRTSDPTVAGIEIPAEESTGYGVPALRFELVYPVEERPQTVSVHWQVWERMEWYAAVKLPVMFRALGGVQPAFLTPTDPGYTWRPSEVVPPPRPQVAAVQAPPPPTWPIPLASLGVLLGYLGGLPWLRRARIGASVLAALGASACLTAWILRGVAVVEVRNPLRPAIAVPAEAEARALFDRLLRNVYAAFGGRSEGEIYDLLAVSVAPELLDPLYVEIYESLILRQEGGAVCQVESIEVVEEATSVDVDAVYEPWDIVPEGREDAPFFRVRWKWRVRGLVSHWGHEHRRINEYEADYVVRNDGGGWRLAAWDVLDHSWVDEGR